MNKNYMEISFMAKLCNVTFSRTVVAGFLMSVDLMLNELNEIKTIVSEAVTNCIVHAYRECTGDIQLTVQLCDDQIIKVEIRDRGCGIEDVRRAREPLFTTDSAGERSGMGFTVMESFCDGVRVSSTPGKGTIVTLFKRLKERFVRT